MTTDDSYDNFTGYHCQLSYRINFRNFEILIILTEHGGRCLWSGVAETGRNEYEVINYTAQFDIKCLNDTTSINDRSPTDFTR